MDVEAFLNLLAHRLRVQTTAEEGRLDRFAQICEPQLSWMLEVAREALEYRFGFALLRQADFSLTRVIPTAGMLSIIESQSV